MSNTSKEALEMAAQCWCDDRTKSTPMDVELATVFAERLDAEHNRLLAMLEQAWGVIANANGGNWDTASEDWKKAAWRCERNFYENIRKPRNDEITT